MGFFATLDERLRVFIETQAMFFVATAPHEGRLNLSPKGLDTFRIVDDRRVTRQIMMLDIESVQTSCGFGV